MKKLFFAVALVAFALTSCDDEDVAPVISTEAVYVAQMVETDNGVATTYTYTYDGDKLILVTDTQGGERNYSYSNNLLIKEEVYNNGTLSEYTIFSYKANNRLAQTTHITRNEDDTWAGIRTAYSYNTDGTISTRLFQGNNVGQYDYIADGIIKYAGGNVAEYTQVPEDENDQDDIVPNPVVKVFTYSNSKAPFKNVFGYEGLFLSQLQGGVNTLTSSQTTVIVPASGEDDEDEEEITTINYTYTYNENGYPVTETAGNITRQYTYTP